MAAARIVLERDGLGGFTVLKVAAEVPISEASIFYHFGSKENLLKALALELVVEEFTLLLQVASKAKTGVEAVEKLIRRRLAYYEGRVDALELVHVWGFAHLSKEQMESVYPRVNHIHDVLEAKLGEDQAAGRVRDITDLRGRVGSAWIACEGCLLTKFRVDRGYLSLRTSLAKIEREICRTFRDSVAIVEENK